MYPTVALDGGVEWNFFDSPTPGATNQLLRIDQDNYIPQSVSIISAYPNPFNPNCTINFQASQRSEVTIQVYNLAGQLVLNRSQKIESIGLNKWVWNGTSDTGNRVGSGIYLLQISDGISSSLVKIVFAK